MTSLTIFAIEEKIEKNKEDLKDLESQLEYARSQNPVHQLAIELHNMQCRWNHTDGCGWYYEFQNKKDDWTGYAHTEYLKRASSLMAKAEKENISIDQMMAIYKIVEGK
jgi:hypothetical protein